MRIIEDIGEMTECAAKSRALDLKVTLVPTMGFLHDGHRELLKTGRRSGGLLVLSIFVNPAQFGPGEDFASYPRDLERDLAVAADAGVDVVFAPRASDMYPEGHSTFVEVGPVGDPGTSAGSPRSFSSSLTS